MARIRTIKPEFFRHEALQDLEIAHPGAYPMMVFCGLWGHCDSKGRFEWKPRQLKLDILPFLPFDMAQTLAVLESSGMVKKYVVEGKDFGEIPSFEKHQRLSGKEITEGEKHPAPREKQRGTTGKQRGSVGEILDAQEGKGKGKEKEEEGNTPLTPRDRGEGEEVESSFSRFWSAWPSNERKAARLQCEKKWIEKGLDLIADQIIAHVEAMKVGRKWREGYIEAPVVYLNQRRWEAPVEVEAYSPEELAVIDEYRKATEPAGWPEVVTDPFSRERAQAIREFATFGDRPDWIGAYFAWMAEKLPAKAGCGFDWIIQKATFIRAKEGNFAALGGDA